MKNTPILIQETIKGSSGKIWEALTDKDKMKQWYFDLAEFKPVVGFEFQFKGKGHKGETYIHVCKITEVDVAKKLQYSWQYKNYPGYSLVTFELVPEGDQTRVQLTHEGLETFPQDNPDFAASSFIEGWTQLIKILLKNFIEKEAKQPD